MQNITELNVHQIWPGMILSEHIHRGRVIDVTTQATTPWGTEMLRITFGDEFEPIVLESTETIKIIKEI
tara:strand:- start:235 stop:441 length:207 start_codon:yes stop_codon:yes gene_type:complete